MSSNVQDSASSSAKSVLPPDRQSHASVPSTKRAEGAPWWETAVTSDKDETRNRPWTDTVDKDKMDYTKPNYYTIPSGTLSYDETTN